MAGILGEAFVEILPSTGRFAAKLEADVKEAVGKVESSSSGAFNSMANVGQKAFIGLGVAAAGFGVAAVKAALEGQESQAQLRQIVENTGTSFEKVEHRVDSLSGSFAKFGYQNDVVESALARLIGVTGDTTRSIDLMQTAADLAAARHLDLAAAAQLVGRAANGNVVALKRMGIEVQVTGDKAKDGAAAIEELNKRFGGAAQAQADTYAGKLKAFRAETENLIEKVGFVLLPILADLAGDGAKVIDFFEHNTTAAAALAVVIGGPLAVSMGAYIIQQGILVATKVADFFETAAIAALYAAEAIAGAAAAVYTALGPVGLVIVGVTALVEILDHMGDSSSKAAKSFSDAFVQGVSASADPTRLLRTEIVRLTEANRVMAEEYATKHNTALVVARGNLDATNTAYRTNEASIKDLTKEVDKAAKAHKGHAEAMDVVAEAGEDLKSKTESLADSLGLTAGTTEILAKKLGIDLTKDTGDARNRIEALVSTLQEANPAALDLRDALVKLSDQTSDARDRVKAFKTALDLLIGGNIDAEKAVVNLYDRIDTLGEKLKANGVNFDLHTKASRENATAIEDTVEAIRTHIETMKQSGLSANDMRTALESDTGALDEQLKKAGYTTDQIEALNKQYGLVPDSLNTVISADPSDALAALEELNKEYRKYGDMILRLPVPQSGAPLPMFADGGWVNAPPGVAVPAVVHGGEFVLSREMIAAGAMGGGSSVVVNQTFAAGTDRSTVDYARDEMMRVLEDLVNRAAAGAGTATP